MQLTARRKIWHKNFSNSLICYLVWNCFEWLYCMNIQIRIKEQYDIYSSSELGKSLTASDSSTSFIMCSWWETFKTPKVTDYVWCVCSDVTGRDEMNRLVQCGVTYADFMHVFTVNKCWSWVYDINDGRCIAMRRKYSWCGRYQWERKRAEERVGNLTETEEDDATFVVNEN